MPLDETASHSHDLLAIRFRRPSRHSPSPASTLSRWEMVDALDKIKVERSMTKDVITVTEQTPVEEAGLIMSNRGISALPVMREGELVGLVTGAVSALGGQFMSFGMTMDTQVITFRVQDVDRDDLLKTIEPLTLGILDVREYPES